MRFPSADGGIMQRHITAIIIFGVSFIPRAFTQTGPDLVKLSAQLYSAMQDLNGAMDTTLQARDAMIAFEQHKTPKTPENHWSDLTDRYRKAIKQIRAAPLPTSFDPSPYAFTPTQLSNCATRQTSLQKAQGYLAELKTAKERADAEVVKVDDEINRVKKANVAIGYLIDKHLALSAMPTFGTVFLLDFLTLETEVHPALADLDTTLKEHRKKLIDESQRLMVAANNLKSNLEVLAKLSCTTLAGRWVGSHRQTLTCPGKGTCVTEETVTANFSQTSTGLSGTMGSSNGKVVSGNCSAKGDRSSVVTWTNRGERGDIRRIYRHSQWQDDHTYAKRKWEVLVTISSHYDKAVKGIPLNRAMFKAEVFPW
jgi:hypothetical protein